MAAARKKLASWPPALDLNYVPPGREWASEGGREEGGLPLGHSRNQSMSVRPALPSASAEHAPPPICSSCLGFVAHASSAIERANWRAGGCCSAGHGNGAVHLAFGFSSARPADGAAAEGSVNPLSSLAVCSLWSMVIGGHRSLAARHRLNRAEPTPVPQKPYFPFISYDRRCRLAFHILPSSNGRPAARRA